MNIRLLSGAALALSAAFASPALAETQAAKIDAGDTAWMIAATGLVLLMTLPGLALFYCGMVRKKNVLATMAQSVAAVCLVSILWALLGYTLSFSGDAPALGNLDRALLHGIGMESVSPLAKTIPESLFMLYQMTFAIITVALVSGAVADRMRFSAFLLFSVLWLFIVYVPLAHWVWGGGFLQTYGLLDFAGGTVVHINAGIAGLVAALVLGKRRGYGTENLAPYDLSMAVVGTGLLWVGWFGFNGGSARGKPSVLGIISGAVAGLGTITPASGYVLPWHGVVIGIIAGGGCYWACTRLKLWLGYDDSLDVFGVHGIGGMIGTTLTGVFATAAISVGPDLPKGVAGLLEGNPRQVGIQLVGVMVTVAWSGVATYLILKLVGFVTALRVMPEAEQIGLDITLHGESIHS